MSATCRDCGQRIVWGVDREARRHPLDQATPVYRVQAFDPDASSYAVERVTGGDVAVYYAGHRCSKVKSSRGDDRQDPPDYRARRAGPDDQEVEAGPDRAGQASAR